MTYRELAEMLSNLTEDQLDMTATTFDTTNDEFFAVSNFDPNFNDTDVLDPNHPVIIV